MNLCRMPQSALKDLAVHLLQMLKDDLQLHLSPEKNIPYLFQALVIQPSLLEDVEVKPKQKILLLSFLKKNQHYLK